MKIISVSIIVFFLLLVNVSSTFAATFTIKPWTHDPDNTQGVLSRVFPDGSLYLQKNIPTEIKASTGAKIEGVKSISTTQMTVEFKTNGLCSASSPRLEITLSNGQPVTLGCTYGNKNGTVTFIAGKTYGNAVLPKDTEIADIDIILDEEGQVLISYLKINDTKVVVSADIMRDQCEKDGWKLFSNPNFKDQTQCVNYFSARPDRFWL